MYHNLQELLFVCLDLFWCSFLNPGRIVEYNMVTDTCLLIVSESLNDVAKCCAG